MKITFSTHGGSKKWVTEKKSNGSYENIDIFRPDGISLKIISYSWSSIQVFLHLHLADNYELLLNIQTQDTTYHWVS